MPIFFGARFQNPSASVSLSQTETTQLLQTIWPELLLSDADLKNRNYAAFVKYLNEELHTFYEDRPAAGAVPCKAFAGLVQLLRDNRCVLQKDIVSLVGSTFLYVKGDLLQQAIDLALRIWLTMNIQSEVNTLEAHLTPVLWTSETSPEGLVSTLFKRSDQAVYVPARIHSKLTAVRLVKLCGIKINWGNNLVDHLNYEPKARVLTIYEHKICLMNHSRSAKDSMFPLAVLKEAIDTLNLLFPYNDKATEQFLSGEKRYFFDLGTCDRDRELDLSRYPIWRAKLANLIVAFNEPTHHWKGLLNDRRNIADWVALWIAVLVLVLTILSIAFGSISTAFAIMQYNFAVAQACATTVDAAKVLPQYCS
jgi:hypothetical protein